MTRMHPPIRTVAGGPLLLFAIVAVVIGGAVSAGTKQQAPEGIPGGRAVFAPWFRTDVLADDNIFRRTESQNPIADLITIMEVGVGMYVPIRMSNLYVGYEGSTFFYRDTNFEAWYRRRATGFCR